MRKNHQPLWLSTLRTKINQMYTRRFLIPQFDHVGENLSVYKPHSVKIFGTGISLGQNIHIISEPYLPVNLSCWSSKSSQGSIDIGDYVLISPGAKLASNTAISIAKNCMIAAETYISDSDWHGVYNRTRPFRCSKPVSIKENVWIGYRAIIGKGVCIGKNSIVAAGSVVIDDIPDNVIVGGNPAKVIKTIDPSKRMITREFLFSNPEKYAENEQLLKAFLLLDNTTLHWLRTMIKPTKQD